MPGEACSAFNCAYQALMSREAEKALESELTEGDKQNKTVSGCISGSVSDMLVFWE